MEQSKIFKRISQLQETLATQHTKVYLADDQLILSGANLETAYFTNRQDRYIQVDTTLLQARFYTNSVLKPKAWKLLLQARGNHRKTFLSDGIAG